MRTVNLNLGAKNIPMMINKAVIMKIKSGQSGCKSLIFN
jgi:hypothetical protein